MRLPRFLLSIAALNLPWCSFLPLLLQVFLSMSHHSACVGYWRSDAACGVGNKVIDVYVLARIIIITLSVWTFFSRILLFLVRWINKRRSTPSVLRYAVCYFFRIINRMEKRMDSEKNFAACCYYYFLTLSSTAEGERSIYGAQQWNL